MQGDPRRFIEENGKWINKGSEAQIYLYNGWVWKVYSRGGPLSEERARRNAKFLLAHQATGCVPYVEDIADAEMGLIKMEFIPGQTLRQYQKTDAWKNGEYRNRLLEVIWQARVLLPHNIEFMDFRNPDNIIIQTDDEQWPLRAIFLEGGMEKIYKGCKQYHFFFFVITR
jgi:tRNA A-37 threonylcarbamoyl transferase component Bud32